MSVLIQPAELAEALAGAHPPVVLDARYPGPAATGNGLPAFEAAHIPGSVWVDVDTELAGPHLGPGGRHPLPDPEAFAAAMRRVGVRHDRGVVVLDAANSLAAARLWWLLRDAGHEDVRVLDGGFAAWERAGGVVATGPAKAATEGDFAGRPGRLPIVGPTEIQALIESGVDPRLWDVRTPERYRGESEPIDPVAGHIPGARNLPATTLFEDDGTFLPADRLRTALAGVNASDTLYCGSGLTAAQVLLAMEVAGVAEGVRLYPGSWSDWISSPDRPVATG
ncbi:sulfurtransferase [Ammonicoccus fulvus]|uniref:Sulfurtransferase n=1 Tax=Ammonicoccus fulvus TaxID=3138240 RepID=A0ABZ3FPC9_9ACTN